VTFVTNPGPGENRGQLELEPSPTSGLRRLLDVSHAVGAGGLGSGSLRPRQIFGDDDRQQIADAAVFPWSAICHLDITLRDGSRHTGTGWLAGPRVVVTAGHCVHSRHHGGWSRSISVTPGRSGDQAPHGRLSSAVFRSVTGWTKRGEARFDYGAILLPSAVAHLGQSLDTVALGDADLGSTTFNVAGYPDDKPEGTLWWHARALEHADRHHLHYKVDTEGGQSGAPVWRKFGDRRQVLGIHIGSVTRSNRAVRITTSVLRNLQTWMEEAGS
jgi:V8-like Glu-specific endopeptidase